MAALNETVSAIKSLKIQGASEVRKAAVLAIAQEAEKTNAKGIGEFRGKMRNAIRELYNSRPTEPELRAAMQALLHELAEAHESVAEAKRELKKKCIEYEKDRESALKKIAEIGARKIEPGQTILVHCHSNSVMGILKKAKSMGKKFNVICTESRPLLQGRITARELCNAGIPVTMIVDSAVESAMHEADSFFSGADAVLADGSVANKIGTATISAIAKAHSVPHFVACSSQKFDPVTIMGKEEKIEERDWKEVWKEKPKKLLIRNPAFDITNHSFVSEIISELGVHSPEAFALLMYGEMVWKGKDHMNASVFRVAKSGKRSD